MDALIEREGWRDRVKLLLQVHDELVFEVKVEGVEDIVRRLRSVMEAAGPSALLADVPILAEGSIGSNWGDMKKVARE